MNRSKVILTVASVFSIIACSSGSHNTPASPTNNTGQGTGGAVTWQQIQADLNSTANGTLAIQIDPVAQTIELIIPFPFGNIVPNFKPTPVPGLPGATVGLANNGNAIGVTVPLSDILKGGSQLSPLPGTPTLPNGQALLNFPSGANTRGVALNIPGSNCQVTLYFTTDSMAAYIAIAGDNIPVGLNNDVVNASGNIIGDFALIPATSGFTGGAYMEAQIPADVAQQLAAIITL